jgi:hypothetical protein
MLLPLSSQRCPTSSRQASRSIKPPPSVQARISRDQDFGSRARIARDLRPMFDVSLAVAGLDRRYRWWRVRRSFRRRAGESVMGELIPARSVPTARSPRSQGARRLRLPTVHQDRPDTDVLRRTQRTQRTREPVHDGPSGRTRTGRDNYGGHPKPRAHVRFMPGALLLLTIPRSRRVQPRPLFVTVPGVADLLQRFLPSRR